MFREILSANGFEVEELSNAAIVVIIPYVDKDDYENIEEFVSYYTQRQQKFIKSPFS